MCTVVLGRLGVACLTLCPRCAGSDVVPPVSVGTASRLVPQHCIHLGMTVADMAKAPTRPRRSGSHPPTFTDSRVDPKLLQGQRPDAIEAGGSIEVYPDAEGAQLRQQYIQGLQRAAPIVGTEYSYLDGPVLVRVTGRVVILAACR